MTRAALALLATLFFGACAGGSHYPEAALYPAVDDATAQVAAALARAAVDNKRVILVMGANWCHDSRGLAGWFETPRFAEMLAAHYEIVYIDAGQPQAGLTNNLDIAQRFGLERITGTPTVLVLSPEGTLLNPETAPRWRNAASRSEDEIFGYFAAFEPEIQSYR